MSLDLSEILVIGVSTRVLFNLEKENEVFANQGIEAFRKFQLENEDELLDPGAAFYLVQSLLQLNKIADKKIVEVVVMSRNGQETGVRVLNSNQKVCDVKQKLVLQLFLLSERQVFEDYLF